MRRLLIILLIFVIGAAPVGAQSGKPFVLPVALPPGPATWLFGQPYGNTAGAYLRGDEWYSAGQRLHFGIDLSMPCGTPLVAIGDGEVVAVDDLSFGSAPHNLLIRHDAGYVSLYGHLLGRPALVPGQRVSAGQEVAQSGDPDITCDSRPHLHLEIRSLDYRTAYNPVALIDAPWHTLALAGPFRYPLFQQNLDDARRWLTLDDQPDVAFGGQALNIYAATYPLPEAYAAPMNAPLAGREADGGGVGADGGRIGADGGRIGADDPGVVPTGDGGAGADDPGVVPTGDGGVEADGGGVVPTGDGGAEADDPGVVPTGDGGMWGARRVAFDGCCANASWHPTQPDLLYLTDGPAGQRALMYEWDAALGGPTGVVLPAPAPLRSPDGSHTITMEETRAVIRREADGAAWAVETGGAVPTVSADNTQLMWLSAGLVALPGEDGPPVGLWVSAVDGSNARPLASAPGLNAMWMDGRRLLVWQRAGINTSLFVYDTATGETIALGAWDWLRGLSVAPGGGRLMFYLAYQADPAASGVYTIETRAGAQAVRLPWFGGWRWRDGESVYYVPMIEAGGAGGVPTVHALHVYEMASGADSALTDPAVTPFVIANGDWSVSADGARVAFWNAVDMTVWVVGEGF